MPQTIENACASKRQYRLQRHALRQMNRLLQGEQRGIVRPGNQDKGPLMVYDCPFCAFWHVGHSTPGYGPISRKRESKARKVGK